MPWKSVLNLLAVLIAILIATSYVVHKAYDFNKFKPEIIREVKEATGRNLRLEGDLALSIGLTPALVVQNVGLQNAAWGSRPEMAKIKRLEVQVRILPLMRGRIEVKRFVMVAPDLLIETHKSGRSNLEFKRAKPAKPEGTETGGGETGRKILSMLSFNELRIEKGRLTYKHGPSGRSYALRVANLTLGAPDTEAPVDLSLKGSYKSRAIEASGTLGPLAVLFDPDKRCPLKLTVDVAAARFSVDGSIKDALRPRNFDFAVTAQGRSLSAAARLVAAVNLPDVGPFSGTARLNDRAGRLSVEDLRLRFGTEDLATADLSGAVKDPLARRGIDVAFTVQGKNVSNLEKLVRRPLHLTGPFKVSGRASCPGSKKYTFGNLKVLLGETRLEGSVETDFGGTRPRVGATLSSQKLDLRSLLSRKEAKGAGATETATPEAKKKRVFSEEPLTMGRLKKADLRITLRAEEMVLPTLRLNRVELEMTTEAGRLGVKRWRSSVGKGTLDGRMDLVPLKDGLSLSLNLKVRQVGVENVLKALKAREGLEGKVDVDIELIGRGRSIASLISGSNGKIVIVSGKGRIKNDYVEVLGSDFATGAFRLINPFKQKTDYTHFNCFVSGFYVKDGLAEITALVMDTDQTTVVGQGRVNLKNEELDVALEPSPKKGLQTGIFGKLNLSFGELAKPVKLCGTLANPSFTLDPTLTALALGKAVGGLILFGPLGIAAALAGCSSGEDNPCLAAIESARKGIKVSEDKHPDEKKKPEEKKPSAAKPTEGINRVFEGNRLGHQETRW